jgi:endoglucanase
MFMRRLILLALACALAGSTAMAQPPGTGYWHTAGNQILDSNNQPVRIAGINWYGLELPDMLPGGLWYQDYRAILGAVKSNGYNVIRIPFSNQMVESPIIPSNIVTVGINTDLAGLNALQILDKIVIAAGDLGLKIILDNHRSEAGSSAEDSGLWYTSSYPESAWINDWTALAERYLNNSTVIGVDLRNEPGNATSGGSCWGCGTAANDWRLAAERAGNAVLAVNPSLLIFVEGTDWYNGDWGCWGEVLEGVQDYPVVLNVANQLVYSAHDYGPPESWFNDDTTYTSLATMWTKYWGYLSFNGIAPVWVGEFGTDNDSGDLEGSAPGSQGQWFQSLVTFLLNNPEIGWTYWTLNGEDTYGLLGENYGPAPVSALKQGMLASIQSVFTAPPPAKIGTYNAGQWYLDGNGNGIWDGAPADVGGSFGAGLPGAIPVTGDWNGDGHTKMGAYHQGDWYLDFIGNGTWDGGVIDKQYAFGWNDPNVIPVAGDWNGDGRTKIGIYYKGFWYLDYDGNGVWDGGVNDKQYAFGWNDPNVIPVVGDWNGDGRTKIGIYYKGFWYLDYDGNGVWDGGVKDKAYTFGWPATGVTPMLGDWSGTGTTKIGIYYQGFWYLDYDGNGVWDGGVNDKAYNFGWPASGVTPLVGNWGGDGKTKIGIFYNGYWYLDFMGDGVWDGGAIDKAYVWGQSGDTPIVGRW